MNRLLFIIFFSLTACAGYAQEPIKNNKPAVDDSVHHDSMHDMYDDLLNDDPKYNLKYKWYIPAYRVVLTNVASWAVTRYVYNFEWARISPATWKYNLKHGFEWDSDRFGTNFIGHPHTGNLYYNVARSNGYNYFQSVPFAIGGSLMWEYFGENTRPSINDIINTPVSGAFLGEIFYRISSNILDDHTRGRERVLREIFAGLIDPPRALNRLTQGKMSRHTPGEVYQKEPLNATFDLGAIRINNTNTAGKDVTNAAATLQLDYGNPFEARSRKPFDLFRLRVELNYGTNTRLLGNVNGYGILFGKNYKPDRLLAGIFQHFDYWNNSLFQIGAIGFGGGLIGRIPVAQHSNIFSTLHLGVVPLAGNNTRFGPDTSEVRQYNFGGGLEAKAEETFNLNKWASVGFTAFYYYIHTYVGIKGNSLVGILKPNVTFHVYKGMSLGYEHFIYQNDRYNTGITHSTLHLSRTEDKVFLRLFLEDPKRRAMYH